MIFFIAEAYYEVGKTKWQNVNCPPNLLYIFIKQDFRAILPLPPALKNFLPRAYDHREAK